MSIITGCNGKKPETTISTTTLGSSVLIGYRNQFLPALAPVDD